MLLYYVILSYNITYYNIYIYIRIAYIKICIYIYIYQYNAIRHNTITNDIQRDNTTSDVDELKQYNDEILHEMKRNYKIYLDEFNKSKRPAPLNPLENVQFIDDYKSFLLDELYFVLEQMKVLDERIRCEYITPANKRWLELRRKTFGKKFDCLHEFRGSLLKK